MKIKVGIPRLRVGILRHQDTPGHLPGVEQTVVSRQSPSLARSLELLFRFYLLIVMLADDFVPSWASIRF